MTKKYSKSYMCISNNKIKYQGKFRSQKENKYDILSSFKARIVIQKTRVIVFCFHLTVEISIHQFN